MTLWTEVLCRKRKRVELVNQLVSDIHKISKRFRDRPLRTSYNSSRCGPFNVIFISFGPFIESLNQAWKWILCLAPNERIMNEDSLDQETFALIWYVFMFTNLRRPNHMTLTNNVEFSLHRNVLLALFLLTLYNNVVDIYVFKYAETT